MGILDDLIGNRQLRNTFEDFVNRYEQGPPSEGYSDQEVIDRYRDVAHSVPRDQYMDAAQEALARLSPEERAEFVKMLQERANARGVNVPRQIGTDPRDLGEVVTDLHERPGQLRDILTGDTRSPQGRGAGGTSDVLTNVLASPAAKAALAGIAAMVVKRVMRGSA
jgi:hypothetical protein